MNDNPDLKRLALGRKFDSIIIGAGHNGLVCGAYLAKAGFKTLILEQRPVVGGACVTEEIAGCQVSRNAYVYSLFHPKIVNDLNLKWYGLELIERDPPSFTPTLSGDNLFLYQDRRLTFDEISRFSRRDAFAYIRYEDDLDRIVKFVDPLLLSTPPNPNQISDWPKLLKLGYRTLKLGKDLPLLKDIFTLRAYDFVTRYFESEPLIATLCTDGIIGAVGGPFAPGTAYVLLHHVMGEVNGHRGRWGYVKGGMGQLSRTICNNFENHGGIVACDTDVSHIIVIHGRAKGVVCADGTIIAADRVISSADPAHTFLRLTDPIALPEDFVRSVRNTDYSSAASKCNLVVNGDLGFNHYHARVPGTFHICEDSSYIERAADEAKHGRIPTDLVLEGCVPSSVDPTLASKGRNVISLLVQYTPYRLAEGDWPHRKQELLDKIIAKLAQYTNINELEIVASDVITPYDLEKDFRLTGGSLFQGSMTLGQLFCFRPVYGYADYRTPVRGLWLCGSAAHPGGGVTGLPGHNAAREIIKSKSWFKF